MSARTNPPSPQRTASYAGILRPDELARRVQVRRWPASERVAPWVENHWSLRWDLLDGVSYDSETLPHPTCSLTVERGTHPRPELAGEEVAITGVVTRRFRVDIRGRGRVVGMRFRPGGLAALTGHSARDWTDRTVPAAGVVPPEVSAALGALDLDGDDTAYESGMTAVEAAFPSDRDVDERYARVLRVVADMLEDRTFYSVAQVEERHHVSTRTLQRDFLHYIGVGPKWVLARYRMQDVVSALDDGHDGPLTELAMRHGFYDQAHFTRDFTTLVGVTPSRYRERR